LTERSHTLVLTSASTTTEIKLSYKSGKEHGEAVPLKKVIFIEDALSLFFIDVPFHLFRATTSFALLLLESMTSVLLRVSSLRRMLTNSILAILLLSI